MKSQFIYLIIFLTTLYSQCDSYASFECYSTAGCEWVENIDIEYCDGDLRKAINTLQRLKFLSTNEINDNILNDISIKCLQK